MRRSARAGHHGPRGSPDAPEALQGEALVRDYHERTKHHPSRYAPGPASIDWDAQPDGFRRFAGRDLEAYALLPAGELGPAGVYHYEAETHCLERRCTFDDALAERLSDLLGETAMLLGLSLVPWREAWKYGLRAWRYCQLDLGHGLGALSYAAAALGWRMREVDGWSSGDLAGLLGLDRPGDFESDEPEYPATLISLGAAPPNPGPDELPPDSVRAQHWQGRANRLDRRHFYRWDQVDAMARLPKASVATAVALDNGLADRSGGGPVRTAASMPSGAWPCAPRSPTPCTSRATPPRPAPPSPRPRRCRPSGNPASRCSTRSGAFATATCCWPRPSGPPGPGRPGPLRIRPLPRANGKLPSSATCWTVAKRLSDEPTAPRTLAKNCSP